MNKAIFLVGGPGSGKDIILKNILGNHNLLEFTLEQVNSTFVNKVSDKDKRYAILNKESFVISTNSYDYNGIKQTKNLLENFGYETAMIFVDVSDDVSKSRFAKRDHFSEENRATKFQKSKDNINKFYDLFEDFALYENNDKFKDSCNSKNLNLFCEIFINSKTNNIFEQEGLNKKIVSKFSLKKKIRKEKESDTNGYPPDVLTKVKTDRIGDEYSIRNSGMGFPSTVGAVYSETFADVADLPSFASFERGMPPPETLSSPKDTQKFENKKPAIKKIKKIAFLAWKGK